MTRVTIDSISLRGAGVVTIAQPAYGHRFTHDSVLLADFCRLRPRTRALELGAGTGIISILLARKHPGITVTAIEVQKEAADLCRWNAQVNGLSDRLTIIEAGIARARKALRAGSFDAIFANPPYRDPSGGKGSPMRSRRIARQAGAEDLATWISAASVLKNRGKFFLIYTAHRGAELITLLRKNRLEPKRLRCIHSLVNKNASMVLVEAVKSAAAGVTILPPLMLHDGNGNPSQEMQSIYMMPHRS